MTYEIDKKGRERRDGGLFYTVEPTTSKPHALISSRRSCSDKLIDDLIVMLTLAKVVCSLHPIFWGPTHQGHNLDKIYGINVNLDITHTYWSHVSTHHLGVVAAPPPPPTNSTWRNNTTRKVISFRRPHPSQSSACLQHLNNIDFNNIFDFNITNNNYTLPAIFNNNIINFDNIKNNNDNNISVEAKPCVTKSKRLEALTNHPTRQHHSKLMPTHSTPTLPQCQPTRPTKLHQQKQQQSIVVNINNLPHTPSCTCERSPAPPVQVQTVYQHVKALRSHGLRGIKLFEITETLINSRINYAAPSWSGFATQQQLQQLSSKNLSASTISLHHILPSLIYSTHSIQDCSRK
ncbi:hypothetical protein HELRODRAFT_171387 [Helobdella robusta]|uniref:Uncharacterized protein n=1 Tax=Helobdella robusta TaxID=6412 RepID=T1F479_HELRO|nr:hypothetical protein HELRODRAFT_171387 [Helobdella robusta]ESO05724.1 hypothetical protein HELRODRAFT_171387 [Helobdella robusta]